jgi:hypothetical protein
MAVMHRLPLRTVYEAAQKAFDPSALEKTT